MRQSEVETDKIKHDCINHDAATLGNINER